MGLFDRIKDNARDLSMKALEATREYDEDYRSYQQQEASQEEAPQQEPHVENIEVMQPQEEAPAAPEQPTPLEEPEFIDDPVNQTPKQNIEQAEKEPEKPAPRKSKVVELTKEEHEKAEEKKRQEKAKQAAKERLAKSYVPSYKNSEAAKPEKAPDKDADKGKKVKVAKSDKKPATPTPVGIGIIDVAPGKTVDPAKKAIYARERAALNALASQRKLNGTVPLYTAAHMNFKTRVFINRIEYSGSFGKNVIPIDQVSWVKLRHGGTGVIIETTEGKRVVMVVKQSDRLAFADAVLKVQAMQPKKGKFRDTKTVRIDELEKFGEGIDEIEKLAKLFDKGILSQEEFDLKKKQILGI